MASESPVAKRGEVQKLCHYVLAIEAVALERAVGLIGIPRGLVLGEVQVLSRNLAPGMTGAVGASLPSLCRVKVRGLA